MKIKHVDHKQMTYGITTSQRAYDVDLTLMHRRQCDVTVTSCAYWDQGSFNKTAHDIRFWGRLERLVSFRRMLTFHNICFC